jgi:hypothetical protein
MEGLEFGLPSKTGKWGWRVEGHHLSLNSTIVNGHLFSTAPHFLGANPAKVASEELGGVRTLAGAGIQCTRCWHFWISAHAGMTALHGFNFPVRL